MASKSKQLIHLAVLGASGKMGQRILALAAKDSRFQIMAGVDRPGRQTVGRLVPGTKAPIVDHVSEVLKKTDVVIDFTSADVTLKNAGLIAAQRKALVVGSTGLTPHQINQLKKLAKKIPIVFSPNMSVGVNVLFQLVRQAAATLAHYDIEIVEAHHHLKKDAPSGTAVKLAEIAREASRRPSDAFVYGRHGMIGPRKKKEIGVMSLRAGDIIGDHTVLLSEAGERLELTHRAHSRDTFAAGSLTAAAWVRGKRPGFYSMLDVLKV